MYPAAQSPIMLNAASPPTTKSVACCQLNEEKSSLVYSRTSSRVAHTSTASSLVQLSSPFHRPSYLSAPSTPRATDSQRWFTVQLVANERGTTPCASSSPAISRNSSQDCGASIPHSSRFSGMYHITLERWTFTGTDQIPFSVPIRLIRSSGKTSIQPSDSKSGVRSSILSAATQVPISSCPA